MSFDIKILVMRNSPEKCIKNHKNKKLVIEKVKKVF